MIEAIKFVGCVILAVLILKVVLLIGAGVCAGVWALFHRDE